MKNHYEVLGLKNFATADEVKRAYRILARRYHPDLNPDKPHGNKFKDISLAYSVLSSSSKRADYDQKLEEFLSDESIDRFRQFYKRTQANATYQSSRDRTRSSTHDSESHTDKNATNGSQSQDRVQRRTHTKDSSWSQAFDTAVNWMRQVRTRGQTLLPDRSGAKVGGVSIVEVTITVEEAIVGRKKLIEINDVDGLRKISVQIPPGVRDGSIVRLRSRSNPPEDLVLVMRLSFHPALQMRAKGLVAEIPISVQEAVTGCCITVPTLTEEHVITVPPGTQSGTEIRLRSCGVKDKTGKRGDLFARLIVKVPTATNAVGLVEKTKELQMYYEDDLRKNLGERLFCALESFKNGN